MTILLLIVVVKIILLYVRPCQSLISKHTKKKSTTYKKKPFRHATFTLSEEAITQLSELSIYTKLAKPHILRILIDELCNRDQQKKLHPLLGSKIN
jgi:hypothetical protein